MESYSYKGYLPLLTMGEWSNDGCYKKDSLSNITQTVCECYHLTHFAILLSPIQLKFAENVEISLQVIGYTGITVSIVAMAVTIFTLIFLKSLHNIRSYIHINLCISLMIAQLIFVVGVDRSGGDHVPAHCQAIAVLLHYFFLVSFMWMLMEGVVLYFILIHVFVTNTRKYIIGFTLASYGIPLLYMSLLTLPLGFALPEQHYGSNSICFLNAETHFIWAFIAPVLVIILTNTGFFVMAAVTLWRQRKNQKGQMDRKSIGSWLKALVFLLVIMGLTWIVGVLVMEVDALLPLAYIFTIMVAFQGLYIFLSVVAFQKSVRDEYINWWKGHIERSDLLSKYYTSKSFGVNTQSSTAKGESFIPEEKGKNEEGDQKLVTNDSIVVENTSV